jgi:hypothetical protein
MNNGNVVIIVLVVVVYSKTYNICHNMSGFRYLIKQKVVVYSKTYNICHSRAVKFKKRVDKK